MRVSTGYSPLAVSPESITQSAPSKTAFATSLPSAPLKYEINSINL